MNKKELNDEKNLKLHRAAIAKHVKSLDSWSKTTRMAFTVFELSKKRKKKELNEKNKNKEISCKKK